MAPPRKKSRLGIACSQCERNDTRCSCEYPCRQCATDSLVCSYPVPTRAETLNETVLGPSELQRFAKPLVLSSGIEAAARVENIKDKQGSAGRYEWQPAVIQWQDTRLRPDSLCTSRLVQPRSVSVEGEIEVLGFDTALPETGRDLEPLDKSTSRAWTRSIHPILLLNAGLDDRRKDSTNPNVGNCLSMATFSTGKASTTFSQAIWRSGDSMGRASSVSVADVLLPSTSTSSSSQLPNVVATSQPIATHRSPILQAAVSPLQSSGASLFGVRTNTELTLTYSTRKVDVPSKVVTEFIYASKDLARRPIADFILGGHDGGEVGAGMIVDEAGALWGWGLGVNGVDRIGNKQWKNTKPEIFSLRKGHKSSEHSSRFARVKYGGARGLDAVVGFEDGVLLYDLRTPRGRTELLTSDFFNRKLPSRRGFPCTYLTSLAASSPSTPLLFPSAATSTPTALHLFCTTRELVWVDERMPGVELMTWEHGRAGKRSKDIDHTLGLLRLASDTREFKDGSTMERVALHSRLTPLLDIHTYSSSLVDAPRILLDPYPLPTLSDSSVPPWSRSGLAIVPFAGRSQAKVTEKDWLVLESGHDGSLRSRYLNSDRCRNSRELEAATGEIAVAQERRQWDELQVDLACESNERIDQMAAVPGLGKRSHGGKTSRLADVHRRTLRVSPLQAKDVDGDLGSNHEHSAEAEDDEDILGRRLGRASSIFQTSEAPTVPGTAVGNLTLFDLLNPFLLPESSIVEDSDDEMEGNQAFPPLPRPSTFSRTGQAPSRLPSRPLHLFTSIIQEGIAQIEDHAPSSFSIDARFHLGARSDVCATPAPFSRQVESAQAVLSRRYNRSSLSYQLALELVASTRSYSSTTITPDPPATARFARHHPSPLALSYFHTVEGAKDDFEDADLEEKARKPSFGALGVRRILSEWEIGSDVTTYCWEDVYSSEKGGHTENPKEKKDDEPKLIRDGSEERGKKPRRRQADTSSFLKQPLSPVRESSSDFYDVPSQAATQPARHFPESTFSSQQQPIGGSQVLPGAFGGRAVLGKERKKDKKKRVSGF